METGKVKVSAERIKRKYLERKKGQRDAQAFLCENYSRTMPSAYKAKHSNQSVN